MFVVCGGTLRKVRASGDRGLTNQGPAVKATIAMMSPQSKPTKKGNIIAKTPLRSWPRKVGRKGDVDIVLLT